MALLTLSTHTNASAQTQGYTQEDVWKREKKETDCVKDYFHRIYKEQKTDA